MDFYNIILNNKYFESVPWIILGLILLTIFVPLNKIFKTNTKLKPYISFFEKVVFKPLILLSIELIIEFIWKGIDQYFHFSFQEQLYFYFSNLAQLAVVYWLIVNVIKWSSDKIMDYATKHNYKTFTIFLPSILTSIECLVGLGMVNMLLLTLHIDNLFGLMAEKVTRILLILTISWILYKIINTIEEFIINKYINENANAVASRKIHTQVNLLKRLLLTLLVIISFCAILMSFDSIKSTGENILTTAGILSAITAFASQQSLGRIFAGLQIAFTQPVKIGDIVIIENEFGEVEEITLSFITIKLWDLRRLILPTDLFIKKGLLNLTRESSELLGTVFLYVDYTLPVTEVRKNFFALLETLPLWNKRTAKLDVTDIKEKTMELRCLVSANNASDLWRLRCEIRESMIQFIVDNYAQCLTKDRSIKAETKKSNEGIEA